MNSKGFSFLILCCIMWLTKFIKTSVSNPVCWDLCWKQIKQHQKRCLPKCSNHNCTTVLCDNPAGNSWHFRNRKQEVVLCDNPQHFPRPLIHLDLLCTLCFHFCWCHMYYCFNWGTYWNRWLFHLERIVSNSVFVSFRDKKNVNAKTRRHRLVLGKLTHRPCAWPIILCVLSQAGTAHSPTHFLSHKTQGQGRCMKAETATKCLT